MSLNDTDSYLIVFVAQLCLWFILFTIVFYSYDIYRFMLYMYRDCCGFLAEKWRYRVLSSKSIFKPTYVGEIRLLEQYLPVTNKEWILYLNMMVDIGDMPNNVVYIEYENNQPVVVYTIVNLSFSSYFFFRWDFLPYKGDQNDIRAYCSGERRGPQFYQSPESGKGFKRKIWYSDGIQINVRLLHLRLSEPLALVGLDGMETINPFHTVSLIDYHSCEYERYYPDPLSGYSPNMFSNQYL